METRTEFDVVQLELARPEPTGRVRIALRQIHDIQDLIFEGRILRFTALRGAIDVRPVVAALELAGIQVELVQVAA